METRVEDYVNLFLSILMAVTFAFQFLDSGGAFVDRGSPAGNIDRTSTMDYLRLP